MTDGTLRSYKNWTTRFNKSGQTPAEFLSGLTHLSRSSFAQAKNALQAIGVELGDLSNIPRAHGQPRLVDVPTDEIARKIVEANNGTIGLALKRIYETGRRTASVLSDDQFKDLDSASVYMAMLRIRKQLKLRRNYTSKSIRYAGIRRIALRDGFLAAHKALDVKDSTITESILGKKCIANLAR